MTITGPTDAIFKAFSMIALKFEEVSQKKKKNFSLEIEIQTLSHVCFNVKYDLFNVLFSSENGCIFINAFGGNTEEK